MVTEARKLKKLFLVTRNMKGGGCERVIAQLANRFSELGICCTLFTEYRNDSFYKLDPRVRLIPLIDRTSCTGKDVPEIFGTLRKIVKQDRPDLVLAMPDMVNVWTALFLAGTGVPVIVSERNDPSRYPQGRVKRCLRKPAYRFVDGIVFQTDQQRAFFPENIRRKGIVLDNPLDTGILPEPFTGEREKTIVTAARLAPQKNLGLLLEAFRLFSNNHPDWRLVIYGEGQERAQLENMARSFSEGTVLLPGENCQLMDTIRKAGMFVLSSDYEGMPNALIEAMSLGLPCIATDCPVGGPASLIVSGENGLLVPVGEKEEMARAMSKLADDGAFCDRIASAAPKIRDRLALENVAEKWISFMEGIMKQKR